MKEKSNSCRLRDISSKFTSENVKHKKNKLTKIPNIICNNFCFPVFIL